MNARTTLPPARRPAPPRLSASSNKEHLDFWKRRLTGVPVAFDFPLDGMRPECVGPETDFVPVGLSAASVAALREFARKEKTDLFTVLLAGWRVLLFRCADQGDFVVGCTGSPRLQQGDDGFLIARTTLRDGDSFREVIGRCAATLDEAIEFAQVSFDSLLFTMQIDPGLARHPLFHAGFFRRDDLSTPRRGPTPAAYPPCDLGLEWSESGGRLDVRIEYPVNLFERTRVEKLAISLQQLLDGMTKSPDAPIGNAPLLGSDELCDLASWNDTSVPHASELSLAEIFARQARRTPNACAIEGEGQAVSYAELDRRANQLAHALRARGVAKDVTVAISIERSVEMVLAVLGVLKAGGAYVPLDPAYPSARLAYMIADSGARLLLTQASLAASLPAGRAESLLLDRDWPSLAQLPVTAPEAELSGENLGYVIYTSGSTGQPKGVAMPQIALTNLIAWQLRQPHFMHGGRTLQFSSLSFDVSFQELFATWASGGTLVLVRDAVRRDPASLLDHLVANRVGRLFLPFVALRGLAEAAVLSGKFPVELREVYTAGEQLQVDETVRRFFAALPGCVLENQYGPSESHVVTAHTLQGAPESWPALPSIGRPIANTSIHILDPRGQRRPVGIPGELFIGGLCLARGYLGKPELTRERFVEDPFARDGKGRLYRTGDLARWMPDGTIQFLGRIDQQVKFRGFRIEPGEIATVLSGFPGVSKCAVLVREIKGVGSRLVAYVVAQDRAAFPLAHLHHFAREKLPDYMVPSHFVVLDSFPLTPSGKVDLKALPEPVFDRDILGSQFVGPRTPAELALARIWSRLLGVAQIGVNDDFFVLGGDSLMAVELFGAIRKEFGRELSPGELARRPTVAGLAEVIADSSHGLPWSSLVPIQTAGAKPPFYCVHGGSGVVTIFPRLARQLPADQPFYGLQTDGKDGFIPHPSVKSMAAHYLREIRSERPHGPYRLGGACVGGLVAIEMARQLQRQNETVELLVLFDVPNTQAPTFEKDDYLPEIVAAFARPPIRSTRLRLILHRVTRTRAPKDLHGRHELMTFTNAVWRYRIRPFAVPTLCFVTGEKDAAMIGHGHWNDDARGWSHWESPTFRIHRIAASHTDILHHPDAARILRAALSELDAK